MMISEQRYAELSHHFGRLAEPISDWPRYTPPPYSQEFEDRLPQIEVKKYQAYIVGNRLELRPVQVQALNEFVAGNIPPVTAAGLARFNERAPEPTLWQRIRGWFR